MCTTRFPFSWDLDQNIKKFSHPFSDSQRWLPLRRLALLLWFIMSWAATEWPASGPELCAVPSTFPVRPFTTCADAAGARSSCEGAVVHHRPIQDKNVELVKRHTNQTRLIEAPLPPIRKGTQHVLPLKLRVQSPPVMVVAIPRPACDTSVIVAQKSFV